MIRPGTTAAAVLFGAVGFGLGLTVAVGPSGFGDPTTWVGALAMTGFGAGTGAGIGRGAGWPFKLGIAGTLAGAVTGFVLDLFGADYAGAGMSAAILVACAAWVDANAPAAVR